VEQRDDILVVDVGCVELVYAVIQGIREHTLVLGHLGDFGEKFDKVWKVIAEELGSNDKVFARVIGGEFAAEQLSLPNYSNGRALFRILDKKGRLAEMKTKWRRCRLPYPSHHVGHCASSGPPNDPLQLQLSTQG
jgi:hypothetical protein